MAWRSLIRLELFSYRGHTSNKKNAGNECSFWFYAFRVNDETIGRSYRSKVISRQGRNVDENTRMGQKRLLLLDHAGDNMSRIFIRSGRRPGPRGPGQIPWNSLGTAAVVSFEWHFSLVSNCAEWYSHKKREAAPKTKDG